ncbi:MAG: NfeD family protein [Rhodothermales bacterium]
MSASYDADTNPRTSMKRFSLLAFLSLLLTAPIFADDPLTIPDLTDGEVFIVPIHGMIDKPLAMYLERALADAEEAGAALIIFDIDTFGGLLDAADLIRKDLLDTSIPTIAFIDKNAASAGALIAYAMDRIVMVPGASMGAATVVEGMGGEAAPDKYQSYMRGLMRATAEAKGRDPQIAEAMVDENLAVEGVSEAGQVLTLSAQEAEKLGVVDAILPSIDAVVETLDLAATEQVAHRASGAERLLRFFANPVLQSILMLMMMAGLYFELQSPGVGFAGLMALVGAALFFAPHYMLGLVESWEIVLFGLGVVLIAVEIFVIPGFGIAGVGGLTLVIGSLLAALIGNVGFDFPTTEGIGRALGTLATTMVLFVILMFSLGRYLPQSSRFNRLVLTADVGQGSGLVLPTMTESTLLGERGRTLTALRPSGTADLAGERLEVVSDSGYIEPGTPITVTRVRGQQVMVRPVTEVVD